MLDKLKVKGAMFLELRDELGNLKEFRRKDNLILSVGFDFICDAIANPVRPSYMGYIAAGTGTVAADASQTALVTELNRVQATYAHTVGTKVLTLTAAFGVGLAVGSLTEAGIVNAAVGGTFLDRVVFSVINKGSNDTLTITFQVTLS